MNKITSSSPTRLTKIIVFKYRHVHGIISQSLIPPWYYYFSWMLKRVRNVIRLCSIYLSILAKYFIISYTYKTNNFTECSVSLETLANEAIYSGSAVLQNFPVHNRNETLFYWVAPRGIPLGVHRTIYHSVDKHKIRWFFVTKKKKKFKLNKYNDKHFCTN